MGSAREDGRGLAPRCFLAFAGMAGLAVFVLVMTLAGPRSGWAENAFQPLGFPLEQLEDRRVETERALDVVVSEFEARVASELEAIVRTEIESNLPEVRAAYTRANDEINRTVGAWDAFSREQRNQKIEAAFEQAGLEDALIEFRRNLESGVGSRTAAFYAEQVRRLFDVIDNQYSDLVRPEFREFVRETLAAAVARDARQRLGDTPTSAANPDAPVPLLPIAIGVTIILVRRIVVTNLGNAIVRRLGATLVGRALTGAGKLFGPVGLLFDFIVAIGALVFAWQDASRQVQEAITEAIDNHYETEIAGELLDQDNIKAISSDLAGALRTEFLRTRDVLVENLNETIRCVVVHGQTDGTLAEIEGLRQSGQSDEAFMAMVVERLSEICRVFGEDFGDLSFAEKLQLIEDIGVGLAENLVRRFGRSFIDFYRDNRDEVNEVARRSMGDPAILARIMETRDRQAELAFFSGLLSDLRDLRPSDIQALAIIRTVAPTLPARNYRNELQRRLLVNRLQEILDLRADDPALAGDVITGIMADGMSEPSLNAILEGDTPENIRLLFDLWKDVGQAAFGDVIDLLPPADMRRFIRDMGPERAAEMMRSRILLDVLQIYRDPERGGARGAIIFFNLYRENQGDLDREAREIVEWLITDTNIPGDRINRELVQNLKTLNVMAYPDFLASPMASALSFLGLIPFLAVVGALALLILLMFIRALIPGRKRTRIVVHKGTRRGGKSEGES